MSDRGFIVIDRALFSHWIWEERPLSKGAAWIDLIGLANYKTVKKTVGENVVTYKRGTVFRSILQLSKRWGWDRKKVTRFLRALESDKMVALNSTTQGTTITIVNYSKYQIDSTTKGTTDGTTIGQRWDSASPQEKIKINKDNKDEYIYGAAPREFPPSVDDVSSWVAEQGLNVSAEKFVAYYSARDWTLAKGRKMKTEADWHGALIAWREDESDGNDKDETRNPNQRDEYGAAEAEYFGTW